MIHALALVAVIGTAPPPAPPLAVIVQTRPEGACSADIDPLFVHQLAPPIRRDGRNPLLWWISGRPDQNAAALPCLRALQVRDRR